MKPAQKQFLAVAAGGLLGVMSVRLSSSIAIISAISLGAFLREKSDSETWSLIGSWLIAWTMMVN